LHSYNSVSVVYEVELTIANTDAFIEKISISLETDEMMRVLWSLCTHCHGPVSSRYQEFLVVMLR
jgi:hypothetical protein